MTDPASDILLINVLSTSFSGSTWLASLLGAHPRAFVVGEIDSMTRSGVPLCTLHGSDCPVWSKFDPASTENPYLQIARIAGKRVLVITNTRKFLVRQRGLNTRWVLLVRDGRAVAASAMRKDARLTVWRAARSWASSLRKKQRLLAAQDPRHTLVVGFEALLNHLERDLPGVCDRLSLTFDPAMLEYWKVQSHYLGGNPGSMSTIAREQNLNELHYQSRNASPTRMDLGGQSATLTDNRQIDLDFYKKADPRHFADERWRTELSRWQLRVFGLAAGRLNRQLGYRD